MTEELTAQEEEQLVDAWDHLREAVEDLLNEPGASMEYILDNLMDMFANEAVVAARRVPELEQMVNDLHAIRPTREELARRTAEAEARVQDVAEALGYDKAEPWKAHILPRIRRGEQAIQEVEQVRADADLEIEVLALSIADLESRLAKAKQFRENHERAEVGAAMIERYAKDLLEAEEVTAHAERSAAWWQGEYNKTFAELAAERTRRETAEAALAKLRAKVDTLFATVAAANPDIQKAWDEQQGSVGAGAPGGETEP